jgi:hypothetical protein
MCIDGRSQQRLHLGRMVQLTVEQTVFIVKTFHQTGSLQVTQDSEQTFLIEIHQ